MHLAGGRTIKRSQFWDFTASNYLIRKLEALQKDTFTIFLMFKSFLRNYLKVYAVSLSFLSKKLYSYLDALSRRCLRHGLVLDKWSLTSIEILQH